RVGAIAAAAVAAVAAALVWGSGLDRLSRTEPALARLVPGVARSNAWFVESTVALRKRQPSRATAAARLAVIAEPVDAGSVSALAGARLAAGDGANAARAFRVAGALGWRDRTTQLYWLAAALQAGDFAVAAQRIDALLRQQPALPQAAALLAQLERDPAGRRALAEQLAARPAWLGAYLGAGGVAGDQLADRARVLAEPALRHIGCDEVAPLAQALLASGRSATARELSQSRCGAARNGLLEDGRFAQARLSGGTLFGWQFGGEGGLDIRLERAAGGQAVIVSSSLPGVQVFAAQALQLVPGRYSIRWRAQGEGLRVRLTCQRGSGGFLEARAAGSGSFTTTAAVAGGCAEPWLELAILPDSGSVRITEVSIAPAG
ncbi:MAG: hypothetical protein ABW203_02840, partial [Novosphingobium sp.]